jgi:nicotinamidase-related amidase
MSDCLLVVDLFSDFEHEDGHRLLASLRERRGAMRRALSSTRALSRPVVFANDTRGVWDGDVRSLLAHAFEGPGGPILAELAPASGEAFVVKPRYSAFDLTPLPLILEELEIEQLSIMGMATEMCVTQTAIDARERGYEVSVIADACASVSEENAAVALDYLDRVLGVELRNAADAFAERPSRTV